MMKLRKLEEKDGERMLQWMHDPAVVEHLGTNFPEKTLADCLAFIAAAQSDAVGIHRAITDGQDTYMGTVSLKHPGEGMAEFAITVCRDAMGKGYARYGMEQMLRYGLELGLERIYWCVSPQNARAVRFYDKSGYRRTEAVPPRLLAPYAIDLIWYVYTGEET